jgi:mono/diheme cytochrome c family protein
MDQTVFYIAGGALVALALITSLIGLRSESFPSNGVLRAGVALVAAVVALTAVAAVSSSGEERDTNGEAAANAATLAAGGEETSGGGSASGTSEEPATPASGKGDDTNAAAGDGAQVFASNGCGGCHTLTAASSTGEVGPNLDEALVDKDPAFIKTSIIDPSAEIAPGYEDGIMPQTFEEQISPGDLDALVAYLAQSTSGK